MGTTYYLVDAARKEVLDVGKWYALDAEYGRPVTLAQLAAADPHPYPTPLPPSTTFAFLDIHRRPM